jgi:hypothetical protein
MKNGRKTCALLITAEINSLGVVFWELQVEIRTVPVGKLQPELLMLDNHSLINVNCQLHQ